MQNVLKGLQIARDIPYREPDALFALGGADGMGKSVYLPVGESLLNRHMLLVGGAATGKTNMLLHMARGLRTNMTENDMMVIFDPNGEYYNALYQKGDVVLAGDKRACGPEGPDSWNLFEELKDSQRLIEDASALCSLLFQSRIEGAAHPFYPTAARDLIMALIVYLKRRGDAELCFNQALRELIDGFDMDSMCQILEAAPEFRAFAGYLGDADGERAQGVVACLQQAARELFAGQFGLSGKLGMRGLVNARGGRVLFICYDPARGEMSRPVFTALVDLCLTEALSRVERDGDMTLILDGVGALEALPHLEDALLMGRSKGLRVLMATNSVAALEARYGAQTRSMLSAVGATVAFRLTERASREYIKGLYGRHRALESYRSSVQRGMVEQVVDEHVIGDEDLTALQTGESIISTLHYAPFLFRLRPYGADAPGRLEGQRPSKGAPRG